MLAVCETSGMLETSVLSSGRVGSSVQWMSIVWWADRIVYSRAHLTGDPNSM